MDAVPIATAALAARNPVGGLNVPVGTSDPGAARRAAEQFEAVFLSQMLAPMFQGLATDGPFGGGPGEEMFRSLMIDQYGRLMARSGGVGIADAVAAEILTLQEA